MVMNISQILTPQNNTILICGYVLVDTGTAP
jgi:hypothetical protein